MNTRNTIRLLMVLGACLILPMAFGCGGGGGGSTPPGGNPTPSADPFSITFTSLHYGNFEDATQNYYGGLVGLASTQGTVLDTDVTEVDMTDSAGTSMIATDDGFYTESSYLYDCQGGACTQSGPTEHTGIWASYDPLAADTYAVEIAMANGQTLTASGDYPGQMAIPCILSSSMTSWRDNGDLVLNWTNQTAELNWDQVDMIQIDIIDSADATVLFVKLDATAQSVTIPASVIDAVEAWAGTTVARWQIQTRAKDDDSMNYARGYSDRIALSAGPAPFAISSAYIQHRTFEILALNIDHGLVGLTENGGPVDPTDVTGIVLKDSADADVTIHDSRFYDVNFVWYDCLGNACQPWETINETGYNLVLDNMTADVYSLEVSMDNGQVLTTDIDYPGQTVVPVVDSATMSANWNGADLDLDWTNALADTEVDSLRIVIFDASGQDVAYIGLDATADTLTLPEGVLNAAKAAGDGTLSQWRIQTRAYDANGRNYARGYTDWAAIPSATPFTLEFALLQSRWFENPGIEYTMGLVSLADEGGTIDPGEVLSVAVTDSAANNEDIHWSMYYVESIYYQDCSGFNCLDPVLIDESGRSIRLVDNVPADTYTLSANLLNGQVLSADVSYPGMTPVPVVSSSSMTAQWVNGELLLNWRSPIVDPDWALIDQVRVIIVDGNGDTVINVRLDKTYQAAVIWTSLVADAQALGDGTLLEWQIQTRAYDANGMNYARGYSNRVRLPPPPPPVP